VSTADAVAARVFSPQVCATAEAGAVARTAARQAASDTAPAPAGSVGAAITALHRRRLRAVWRSAGWPCCDLVELDLLAAGLIERVRAPSGHETLRVTDDGVRLLAETRERNRRAYGAHEALVERVARQMGRDGRIVWRGLSLRGRVETADGVRWTMAMPDVFSIRHTTVEDYLLPIVHEVKVSRADLLGDLRREAKRRAYLSLAAECWYVVKAGIARPEDIPPECGLLVATADGLEVARPAPRRAMRLPFAAWMSLARATPCEGRLEEGQMLLGDESGTDDAWGFDGQAAVEVTAGDLGTGAGVDVGADADADADASAASSGPTADPAVRRDGPP